MRRLPEGHTSKVVSGNGKGSKVMGSGEAEREEEEA